VYYPGSTKSIELKGEQRNTTVPCCYPNELSWPPASIDIGATYTNGSQGATTLGLRCPGSTNTSSNATAEFIFSYNPSSTQASYSPSAEAFCGVDPLNSTLFYSTVQASTVDGMVSEIPEINVTAAATPIIDIGQTTLTCTCSVEYPALVRITSTPLRCSDGSSLCPVPNGITGFISSYSYTRQASTDDGDNCGCDYTFSFMDWALVVDADGDVASDYWSHIEWTGGYTTESADDDECLNVTATLCENGGCVLNGSEVDSALSAFDTAGYFEVGGSESGCWCFAMYDVCPPTPTTTDGNTSSAVGKAIGVIGLLFASIHLML